MHVFAQPPKEEPEEPLEGDAVIDLTPSAMAVRARCAVCLLCGRQVRVFADGLSKSRELRARLGTTCWRCA